MAPSCETQIAQPAAHLDAAAGAALVRAIWTAHRSSARQNIGWTQLYAQPAAGEANAPSMRDLAERRQLETSLTVLGEQQALVRPAVEQIIQDQVSSVLAQQQLGAGFKAFPPVWFTFTEPPRKLVVSPRDRIATTYYAMLQPQLPADERETD